MFSPTQGADHVYIATVMLKIKEGAKIHIYVPSFLSAWGEVMTKAQ